MSRVGIYDIEFIIEYLALKQVERMYYNPNKNEVLISCDV